MFEVVICDDEEIYAEKLKNIVEVYLHQNYIAYRITIYGSGRELLESEEIMRCNVVFLDINMDDMDGIETAEQIRKLRKDIFLVFVTAYIDYSLKGYAFNAVRYLIKDKITIEKSVAECLNAIFEKMNVDTQVKEIRFNEGIKKISINQLIYIESNLHRLNFYILEDKVNVYTQYQVMNKIEEKYVEQGFIRIHQSYLVNLKYVIDVKRDEEGYVAILRGGRKLAVSKSRYKEAKQKYIQSKGEI